MIALIICVLCLTFLHEYQARPFYNGYHLWTPAHYRSRADWMRCHGLDCGQWERVKHRMRELAAIQIAAGLVPAMDITWASSHVDPHNFSMPYEIAVDRDLDTLDGCVKLTEEQADELVRNFHHILLNNGKRRKKRKLFDFTKLSFRKWTQFPIKYKFDGQHTNPEKDLIRSAIHHWEAQTCIRFRELGMDDVETGNHLLFTREGTGCHSFIGRIPSIPQQLNLQYTCLWEFGIPVHEIGHALGFWHEHQRWDRDETIKVFWDNLGYYTSQFYKQYTDDLHVPYDIGSIMHYGPRDGSVNGQKVMEARDILYQSSMGQKTGLSFFDTRLMNMAYCSNVCRGSTSRPCERGGYQDPNDCGRCKCPDGFGGMFCGQVAPPVNAVCGGELTATYQDQSLTSPGYPHDNYEDYQECNWKITAPLKHHITMRFVGVFGIYCHKQNQCHHWVEIKYKRDKSYPGPRFCCFVRPSTVLNSETPEVIVTMRTNWTSHWATFRMGFHLVYTAVPDNGPALDGQNLANYQTTKPKQPVPTPAPTPAPTTTTTTTTTTTATTTTIRPTTTTMFPPSPPSPAKSDCLRMDIAFILDSSGSVGKSNWQTILDFVKDVSRTFYISSDHVQVGIVSFGNDATLHVQLNDFDNINDLTAAIDRIPWKDQWTNTSGGIWVTRTRLFSPINGDRPDAPNYGILVTDGESNKDPRLTLPEADTALREGIRLMVVGIGSNVNQIELKGIAVGSGQSRVSNIQHLLLVKDFQEFSSSSTVMKIIRFLCPTYGIPVTRTTKEVTTTRPLGSWRWSCSFESDFQPLCGMSQVDTDNFDWTRWEGSTPSELTGPEAANSGQYYIYIEASNPRKNGNVASIMLPKFPREGTYCLSFYYQMYGFHTDTLAVLVKRPFVVDYPWRLKGEQGPDWRKVYLNVNVGKDDMVGFIATRGQEYSGDIAIDDINVTSGQC